MKNANSTLLSAAQFDIMSVVWDRGEVTINQVLKAINEKRRKKLRRTTIQVQMSRLEKKGWLTHRTVGRTFCYRASRDREEALGMIAGDVTNRIFGGSCAELVKCLFDQNKISGDEIQRLRKVLDQVKGD
jgi:predicted transcriptional regulator